MTRSLLALGAVCMTVAMPIRVVPSHAIQSGVNTGPEELTDTEIDRFVELLAGSPLDLGLDAQLARASEQWVARLKRDNAGRDIEIDELFRRYNQCVAPAILDIGQTMTRRVVREMGRDRVRRISQFINGDRERMEGLAGRLNAGEALDSEAGEELQRLVRTYPAELFEPPVSRPNAGERAALDAAMRPCIVAHLAELERHGLLEAPVASRR